jgi:NADP-dependent aldehyde dehydrogenase
MLESVPNCIGFSQSSLGEEYFFSFDPRENKPNVFPVFLATQAEVEKAIRLAEMATNEYACVSSSVRAQFLTRIGESLSMHKEEILTCYMLETGLTQDRAKVEFNRTLNQLTLFSNALISGELARNVHAPLFHEDEHILPELTKIWVPIGPVLVFGASNFPLAYSTIGGDVAAALAAGCPVIVKGHPMHPGTASLVARCITEAAIEMSLPEGVFSQLNLKTGPLVDQLVLSEVVKAIAFTGSFDGGMSINKTAQHRKEPIPVFAEMGSLNPVVLFPKLQKQQAIEWAAKLAISITHDAGQFCTKPGLIFLPNETALQVFLEELVKQVVNSRPHPMLHPEIKTRFVKSIESILKWNIGSCHGEMPDETSCFVSGMIWELNASEFNSNNVFRQEVFGPFTSIVWYDNENELNECLGLLGGQLTATLIVKDTFLSRQAKGMVFQLSRLSGRLILNGVPTGLRISRAMHHGGPFPSTTDSRFTAVGTDSIFRFCRPLCIQSSDKNLHQGALDAFS